MRKILRERPATGLKSPMPRKDFLLLGGGVHSLHSPHSPGLICAEWDKGLGLGPCYPFHSPETQLCPLLCKERPRLGKIWGHWHHGEVSKTVANLGWFPSFSPHHPETSFCQNRRVQKEPICCYFWRIWTAKVFPLRLRFRNNKRAPSPKTETWGQVVSVSWSSLPSDRKVFPMPSFPLLQEWGGPGRKVTVLGVSLCLRKAWSLAFKNLERGLPYPQGWEKENKKQSVHIAVTDFFSSWYNRSGSKVGLKSFINILEVALKWTQPRARPR